MVNNSFAENGQPLLGMHDYPPSPPKAPQYSVPLTFAKKISDVPRSENDCYEGILTCCGNCMGSIRTYIPCCCCCMNPYIIVPQGQAGIFTKFGKAYKVVDPGMYFVNQMTEEMHFVDTKIRITDIPRQVVMTKDNVSVSIDSVVYWHVVDPFVARFFVDNVTNALLERTMTTLRDTVGAHVLQSVIENREALAAEIRKIIEETSKSWGVIVEAILVKDLTFSGELQETLASAAKQQRLGESKVILAKAEVQAARLMREASDILNTPAAMQIRYLETLTAMSHQAGTKVIFMPADPSSGIGKMTNAFAIDKM